MPSAPRPRRLALVAVLSAVLLGTGCTATVAGTPAAGSDLRRIATRRPGSSTTTWPDGDAAAESLDAAEEAAGRVGHPPGEGDPVR